MHSRAVTQLVAKSPHAIWWFLADLSNDVLWREEIVDVELVSGLQRQTSAVYRESVQWQGFHADVTLSIVESVDSRCLVVASEGTAYRSRSLWTFEPLGQDTLLTLAFALETSGAFTLAEGLMTDMVVRWLERDLPRLQGHLQSP
ncbi:MAG: SRPBCC family protein [Coriobacteriia bacterium]|nr:SRPBCC family protein [Coriobacteriia bacterium]